MLLEFKFDIKEFTELDYWNWEAGVLLETLYLQKKLASISIEATMM
jgi:hypothetical protein